MNPQQQASLTARALNAYADAVESGLNYRDAAAKVMKDANTEAIKLGWDAETRAKLIDWLAQSLATTAADILTGTEGR